MFFLLGDGTWSRFSWHEETGRNFEEMSVFPPHRILSERRSVPPWQHDWGKVDCMECHLFCSAFVSNAKKMPTGLQRKIMELKHAMKGKGKGNIWNHHKGFCLQNGSLVYLVGVQNSDVLLAICSSKTWSGWEHFWRKMLIIHLYKAPKGYGSIKCVNQITTLFGILNSFPVVMEKQVNVMHITIKHVNA